jgi:hypothetical protein
MLLDQLVREGLLCKTVKGFYVAAPINWQTNQSRRDYGWDVRTLVGTIAVVIG